MVMDTAVVEKGDFYNVEALEGLVLPQVLELAFPTAGLLGEVHVCVGSQVKAGDVLATLDAAYSQQALDAARASLDYSARERELTRREREISLELARLELRELEAAGASQAQRRLKELDAAAIENELAEEAALWSLTLADKEAAIAALEAQLRDSILTAPCDGTVVFCTAAQGGYALADAPLVWLADDAKLEITSDYLTADHVGRADELYCTAAGERVEAEYVPMDRAEYLSRSAAGYPLKSSFRITDDHGVPVESGMSAVIYLITDRAEDALLVPSCAVRRDSGIGYYVYKVVDGVQVRQRITRGGFNDAVTQVLEGLEEGDVVYAGN